MLESAEQVLSLEENVKQALSLSVSMLESIKQALYLTITMPESVKQAAISVVWTVDGVLVWQRPTR